MNNDGLTLNQLAERNAALVTELVKLRTERDQLAAENVGLKKTLSTIANSEEYHGDMVVCDFDTLVTAACSALHTPATDRIVAEAEARGVEKFAAEQRGVAERLKKRGGDVVMSSIKFCLESAEEAEVFAQQLRAGADK
ncbi:hypothetical protein FMJ28_18345 [Klebsiella michiganensis]|uniref:hypothetical protein n=1 Tax=Klebsiella michiganensis TaxID=1134687 RepID=UPI001CCE980C|nr:hypothetical protein [Klebsiella michiganensis]MBZ7455248.1 hypothetical protein [Klebsiella michiganensis]